MMKYGKYIVFLFIVVIMIYFSNRAEKRSKKNELEIGYVGLVESIRSDAKTIPYLTIDDEEYYLNDYSIRKGHDIEVGDSIVKKKGSKVLKHYKKYSGGFYLYKKYEITQ